MSELSAVLFLEWGIITLLEYLMIFHPVPKHTYEELEAANWSPSELGY